MLHRPHEQRRDLPRGYVRESKYSSAQRKVTEDPYASHGRCLALTIKVPGYSSEALHVSWIQQAHPELRPRIGKAHQPLSPQAKRPQSRRYVCAMEELGRAQGKPKQKSPTGAGWA